MTAPTWHTQTVTEFFSQMAWTGATSPANSTSSGFSMATSATPEALDMRSSVQVFFSQFPWDGKPLIAALGPVLIKPSVTPAAQEEFTLDGFADLF
jgi:hypothetical protein